ncbi:MAG: hypothetical protein JO171_06115 [Paludibacterium sp.]|uniref:hypothetical protein n=1 Tax=Paludibacterium sp. TaxID=1917523 RepID=UPI0025FEB7EB|nr:hypothetical protein [Paludibacterium sp.]MBV8046706.1 hypothetical protein [Paludibacterium sp.]
MINCETIARITGWSCVSAGQSAVHAVSPFSLAEGGQHIAFYIGCPTPETFFLTDACETAIFAEQLGIVLSKARLDVLNRTPGVSFAKFEADWSIEATGPLQELQSALWDASKLALALSFRSEKWRPRFAEAKFRAIVLAELRAQLGLERVLEQVRVRGASGHEIEFPIGVRRNDGAMLFVQPVALDNGKLNWPSIYEAQGKLFDLKAASEIENRLTIIEEGAAPDEFNRAINFLSLSSRVRTLGQVRATVLQL